MSIQNNLSKFFTCIATCLILFVTDIHAADMEVLQQQCSEIGFKIKTPDNGKCVLKLLKKISTSIDINSSSVSQSQSIEAAQQRNDERQQSYTRDAQRAQRERDYQLQQEMLALQQRSVAAQESAVRAQRAANYQSIIQGIMPRTPVTCLRNGDFTTCR